MRRRRVLSFVLSCFIICGIICGPTFASGIYDLEDMGIDPWGDLEQLPDVLPGLPTIPAPEPEEPPEEPEEEAGEGIELFSLPPNTFNATYKHISGSLFYHVLDANDNETYTIATNSFTGTSPWLYEWYVENAAFLSRKCFISAEANTVFRWTKTNSTGLHADNAGNRLSLSGNLAVHVYGQLDSLTSSPWNVKTGDMVPTYIRLLVNDVLVSDKIYPATGTSNFDLSGIYITIPSNGITSLTIETVWETRSQSSVAVGPSNLSAKFYKSYDVYIKPDDSGVTYDIVPPADSSAETVGLLGGIIEFLKSIVTGITNIGTAIIELPGKIVTALIDGLKSLFIPSESDITLIVEQYETLFSERLGFIYQAYSWIVSFAGDFLAALQSSDDYEFVFPAISLPVRGRSIP